MQPDWRALSRRPVARAVACRPAAFGALEQDHAFLLRGDVFTADLVQTWITYKREKELDPIRLRPHPHEFYLYYDN